MENKKRNSGRRTSSTRLVVIENHLLFRFILLITFIFIHMHMSSLWLVCMYTHSTIECIWNFWFISIIIINLLSKEIKSTEVQKMQPCMLLSNLCLLLQISNRHGQINYYISVTSYATNLEKIVIVIVILDVI